MTKILALVISALLAAALLIGCGPSIRHESLEQGAMVKGKYTLILYGGAYTSDPKRSAFLDFEGDAYTLKIADRESSYTVKGNVSATDALVEADAHIKPHCGYEHLIIRKLTPPGGTEVIGYEVTPWWQTLLCPETPEVNITYTPKEGGVIKVEIQEMEGASVLQMNILGRGMER